VLLGLEAGSFNKFAGIALSVVGSICMVNSFVFACRRVCLPL